MWVVGERLWWDIKKEVGVKRKENEEFNMMDRGRRKCVIFIIFKIINKIYFKIYKIKIKNRFSGKLIY